MTLHLSNPNANPRKLSRKERKRVHKASQIAHLSPIKKSGYGDGFKSSFNSFMTEFQAAKDKTPKSFESWRTQHVTGQIEQINPKTGKLETVDTWTERKTLPRVSPSAGIGKPSQKFKDKKRSEHETYMKGQKVSHVDYRDPTDPKNMMEFKKHTVEHASN